MLSGSTVPAASYHFCSPSVPVRGHRAKRSRTLPRGGGALPERPDSPGDVTRRGLTRRLANFLGISSPQRSTTSSPTPDAAQQVDYIYVCCWIITET